VRVSVDEHAVYAAGADGRRLFADDRDHFHNALLRLMRLSEAEFVRWLELLEGRSGDLVDHLGPTLHDVRRAIPSLEQGPALRVAGPQERPGAVRHPSLALAPGWGLATDAGGHAGWLVRVNAVSARRELEVPEYEEAYYEGGGASGGSYGDYAAEESWRLEKGRRQVDDLHHRYGLGPDSEILDVGSGYGYFRHAAQERGIPSEGLEISRHAREFARKRYGLQTQTGELAEWRERVRDRFTVITMWDVIEHVADPLALVRQARDCLAPGGVLAIRTPNLDCPEAEIFGPYYHSYQRPHLVYLTPTWIADLAERADMQVDDAVTTSHLLRGFCGEATVAGWARAGRGSDIVAYLRRT
jgi:SAM-dependent methyltransferase